MNSMVALTWQCPCSKIIWCINHVTLREISYAMCILYQGKATKECEPNVSLSISNQKQQSTNRAIILYTT